MANQTTGNTKAKERSEIKGSTRRLKSKKVQVLLVLVDIKVPLFRGGGRAFLAHDRETTASN
jgi:large subunit ribosomal protein L4